MDQQPRARGIDGRKKPDPGMANEGANDDDVRCGKTVESLRARKTERTECRITLEELGFRDGAADRFEVKPAL